MSEQRPWWLSDPPAPEGWTGLLSQAQRMLGWVAGYATEHILAPHSSHERAEEHPDCALCQASALMAHPALIPREEIAWVDGRWTT